MSYKGLGTRSDLKELNLKKVATKMKMQKMPNKKSDLWIPDLHVANFNFGIIFLGYEIEKENKNVVVQLMMAGFSNY